MYRKSVFFVLLICVMCAIPVLAQPDSLWSRTFGSLGSDYSISLARAHDGGYVLLSNSDGSGNGQVWVLKTNTQGDSVWGRVFGGGQFDGSGNIGRTADGGYYFTGYTSSFGSGNTDFWLVKLNSDGIQQWSRTYGGGGEDNCYWGQQTSDGGFILAGETMSFGNSNFDFFIVKVDADGDSLWSRMYGGETADAGATYVVQTNDGGYIISGVTRPAGDNNGEFWLIKLNATGEYEWANTYGNPGDDLPWCVCQCSDGGYIAAGKSTRTSGLTDAWLVRVNSEGDSLWSVSIGTAGLNETAYSVSQTWDDGFIVSGQSGYAQGDFMLVRTNSAGEILWSREFGGPSLDAAYQTIQTEDGGYAIAGGTMSYGVGNVDIWLVKTGPDPVTAISPAPTIPDSYGFIAFPNPFNSSTEISFDLPRASRVLLKVYDVLGREQATLLDDVVQGGTNVVRWDASGFSSGVYFVRLSVGEESLVGKVMLVK